MQKQIDVTFTRDRFKASLVVIESPLGNGMEASPDQLRALAVVLLQVANDADKRPTTDALFLREPRSYNI